VQAQSRLSALPGLLADRPLAYSVGVTVTDDMKDALVKVPSKSC
jgi:hypothetical protein